MTCFRPLRGTLVPGGRVVIGGDPVGTGRPLSLPCGKCIGCRMEKARMWTVRITHEAQLYDSNLFVTLDYAPEHLESWSLQYKDFQLFMKRLRKEVKGVNASPNGKFPIRFFCAGEYGSRFQRPHFHVIFFNLDLADKVQLYNETYRSQSLEALWGKGNCVIGSVSNSSAAYVAGYTMYKQGRSGAEVVDASTGELTERRPEFVSMSRRPGIGAWWYDKYRKDLFPGDKAVLPEGKVHKVPRFYFDRYAREDPLGAEAIKEERYFRALERAEDGTPDRLAVREEYARLKLKSFGERGH